MTDDRRATPFGSEPLGSPEALFARAISAHERQRYEEAEALYSRLVGEWPDHVGGLINLGSVQHDLGRPEAAVVMYERAMKLSPELDSLHNNLANALRDLDRLDEAVEHYEIALRLHPENADAWSNYGTTLKDLARVPEAVAAYRRALEIRPGFVQAYSNLLFALMYLPGVSDAQIAAEASGFDARFTRRLVAMAGKQLRDLDPERKLRVGFVGADFREHCQALFTLPLLENRVTGRMRTYVYSNTLRTDGVTERHRGACEVFRETLGMNDEELAEQVRADGIDVLVDLTMHMAGGRPGVFGRGVAPIQVAWLAYPGTTGVRAMTHRMTDRWLDPEGLSGGEACETAVYLPTFWCYGPRGFVEAPGSLPAKVKGHLTFGALNNPCKVNSEVVETSAEILQAVPTAKLLMLAARGWLRERLVGEFAALGVGAERIEFTGYLRREDYLALYQRIDVALDPWPYNGHTTSLDALYMGVPVLTMEGSTRVGRAGVSQLSQLGLTDWIARTREEYVARAVRAAGELGELARLREELRGRMEESSLMDGRGFAAAFEGELRKLWHAYVARERGRD